MVDFEAQGGVTEGERFRFQWHVDSDQIRDINRAVGFGSSENQRRGFLSRWLVLWLKLSNRPMVEVPTTLSEDLYYIPTPCYVFANSDDRRIWRCWYTVVGDFDPRELIANRVGLLLFSVTGTPPEANQHLNDILRQFNFQPRAAVEDHTFYWVQ